jgi:hypothetical protein
MHCSGDVFFLHLLPNIIIDGIGQGAPNSYEHQNGERRDTNSWFQHEVLILMVPFCLSSIPARKNKSDQRFVELHTIRLRR